MNRLAMAMRALLLVLPIGLAGCNAPPPDAYVTGGGAAAAGEPVGGDARGEACLSQRGRVPPTDLPVQRARDVFCGGWTQPAARVVELTGNSDAAQLDALANGGQWRTWLDQRMQCSAPQATSIGGRNARLLNCTRRQGGWPQLAMVVAGPSGPVLADGVTTALPVMQRLATGDDGGGTVAGTADKAAGARSVTLELAARQLSSQAFGANDIGRYEQLMTLGRELNQAEAFAAAEDAYRAALSLQERVLGRDHPGTVSALMHLGLNLSNQGRQQEAQALFNRAQVLLPRDADPNGPARLLHYRGLAELNGGDNAQALALLEQAAEAYGRLAPASALRRGREQELTLVADPVAQSALLGMAEVRRNVAVALTRLGRAAEAPDMVAESRRLLQRAGVEPGLLVARALRTDAGANVSLGQEDRAARQLEAAARRFAIAAPGERPEAVTLFLAGARRTAAGRHQEALQAFRAGATILRSRQIALPVALVVPYLDALHAAASRTPDEAPALRQEMFAAVQLAQRSNTVRFVQQATARIGAAAGDARVGEAVRRLQDTDQALRDLYGQRDMSGGVATELDARIAALQQTRAEAEGEVAAAAPGYRQLLLSTAEAPAVAARLSPQEALVTMLLGRDHGYVLVLRNGVVSASRANLGEAEAGRLVGRVRAGIGEGRPGRFDAEAATALHAALLAPLTAALDGAETLLVVPDGPLLALPFGLLLTGPAEPDALAGAPWLVRRHAVVHVPSAQGLLTLRGTGAASAAPRAYAGFGDFTPPSAAQLARSFPQDRCAADARLAAGLQRLPGTRVEVQVAQQLTGATAQDVRLGPAFTAAALRSPDLAQHRVIHLATHALLPGELSCLQEPAIVVSTPGGAADANQGFLRASEVLGLKLDADLVVLSACNTGGPSGAGGGEALSGLARAFFYAGARGLLVTHWAVDDAAAALTVADTLRRQQEGASSAAALRGAQMLILEEAGRRLPAAYAHPYYWAPFALLGDGRRAAPAASATPAVRG